MFKTFDIDIDAYERFVAAVSVAYNGHPRGNIAFEIREAIKDRTRKLEEMKK